MGMKKEEGAKLLFYVPLTNDFYPTIAWDNNLNIYRDPTTALIVNNSYNSQSRNATSAIMWECSVPTDRNSFTFNMWCNPNDPWQSGINFMHGFLNRSGGGNWGVIFGKHQSSAFNQIFSYNINRWDDVFGLLPTNKWTFVSWTVHEENGYFTFKVYWNGVKQGEFTEPQGSWWRANTEKFCFGSSGYGNDTCMGYFKHYSVFEEMTDKQVLELYNNDGIII